MTISICPKGWTLPSGGTNSVDSELSKFTSASSIGNNSVGSTLIRNDIYNFKYTGDIGGNGSLLSTDQGYWWSRTSGSLVGTSFTASVLRVTDYYVVPGTTDNMARSLGLAVRCIARDS